MLRRKKWWKNVVNKSQKWIGIFVVIVFFISPALVWRLVRFESPFRVHYAVILNFTPNVVSLVIPKVQVISSVIHNPVRQDYQVVEPNYMLSNFLPFASKKLAPVGLKKPIQVSMIWREKKNRLAIIDRQVVREGQSIREYRVDHIEKDGVLLVEKVRYGYR